MVSIHVQGPEWFFGVDSSLEAFAALTAFLVALAAYRVYCTTRERKYSYFAASFAILTIAFVARSLADAFLEEIFDMEMTSRLATGIFLTGYIGHILLSLTAYLLLIIITLKITDKRVIALIYITLVPTLLLSGSYFLSFYGLSTVFLGFVTIAYFQNHRNVRKLASFLVFLSFFLLTVSQAFFLLEVLYKPLYVAAHVIQAAGYLLLLFALIKTLLKPRHLWRNSDGAHTS